VDNDARRLGRRSAFSITAPRLKGIHRMMAPT
jgi:hypothetical protein